MILHACNEILACKSFIVATVEVSICFVPCNTHRSIKIKWLTILNERHHQNGPNQSHTIVPAYSQHDPEAGHALQRHNSHIGS